MGYTNIDNYPEVEADALKPTGDRILVAWDEKKSTLLGGKLITAQTTRKQHYTGTVLAFGDLVTPEINKGDRILFDQFSNFEKFFDKKHGRLALIEERRQGDCFAIVPARTEVGEGEAGYDFDKD